MKTAVSIPDDLFADADRLAAAQGMSRSRLYADALREYVARHAADDVTRRIDEVVAATGGELDTCVAGSAHRTLRRAEW